MFIAGLCRVYARKVTEPYWFQLPYAPRGYSECEQLIDYYTETWGQFYDYVITADHDLCKPKAVCVAA